MYSFQFDIPFTACLLFGIAILLLILLLWIYLRPVRRIRSRMRGLMSDDVSSEDCRPVSVIVYASDEAESLRHLLPSLLGQDYPAPFEVIVVNEGSSDSTAEVVARLRNIHDNLYLTYTPDGARQLSRKKLGLMIGIKAARFPIVVQTTAAASIPSDKWLRQMVAPFANPATEVVIGPAALNPECDTTFGRRYRAFNDAADTIAWLNAALSGSPYRGSELNLAYTRDVFFRNRGFSRSLNLKYGDDDIFVSEIVGGRNSAVVLHPDAVVYRNAYNLPRTYRELRSRYIFTGQNISHTARYMQAIGSLMLWAIIGLCVAGAWVMWPNLLGVAIGAIIVLGVLVLSTLAWKSAIKTLSGKRLLFSLPYLMLTRPLANGVAWIKAKKNKKYNYTWN